MSYPGLIICEYLQQELRNNGRDDILELISKGYQYDWEIPPYKYNGGCKFAVCTYVDRTPELIMCPISPNLYNKNPCIIS